MQFDIDRCLLGTKKKEGSRRKRAHDDIASRLHVAVGTEAGGGGRWGSLTPGNLVTRKLHRDVQSVGGSRAYEATTVGGPRDHW